MTGKKLMLLDTASLYFRAFYGIPDSLRAPDGTVVNATRGLLDFIARLVTDYEPDALAACWDNDWRPQWRVDLIPSYKEHRVEQVTTTGPDIEETPDLLSPQVPLIREELGLLGIAVVGADGYEADDVIGTLATQASGPVDIVTGDRDLFQLVDDDRGIRILYTARGMSRLEVLDDAAVQSRYGVKASQYADYAALRGDASDGLPGVAGVGEKTARELLTKYEDLAAIVAAAHDRTSAMAPRVRMNIKTAADYLEVAPTVVAVARDLELDPPDLTLKPLSAQAREEFAEFAKTWGLGGAETRVLAALDRRTG